MRAVSVAFYEAMSRPVALQVAKTPRTRAATQRPAKPQPRPRLDSMPSRSPHPDQVAKTWLDAMNKMDAASNVDVFDKPSTDVFKLLPEATQKRSEMLFIKFFHAMFYVSRPSPSPSPSPRLLP